MDGEDTNMEIGVTSTSKTGTAPDETVKELSVALYDIKHDGLVMYDSWCPETTKMKRVGYCLTCEKTLNSLANVYSHNKEHPNHVKILFKCEVCHQNIMGRDTFRFHKRMHSQQGLECNVCHKKFNNRGTLRSHLHLHFKRNTSLPSMQKDFLQKKQPGSTFAITQEEEVRKMWSNF